MAHHDEDLAINGKLVVQLGVALLHVVNPASEHRQSVMVLKDHDSVQVDLRIVLGNVAIVGVDVIAGCAHSTLQGGDGLSQRLNTY